MRRFVYLAVVLAAFVVIARTYQIKTKGTNIPKASTDGIKALAAEYPEAVILTDQTTGLPSTLSRLRATVPAIAAAKAESPQQQVLDFFNQKTVEAAFAMAQPASHASVAIVGTSEDPIIKGNTIVRVQQMVGGVPVFGAESKVVVQPGAGVVAVTSTFVPPPEMPTEPRASAQQAQSKAAEIYENLLSSSKALLQNEHEVTDGVGKPEQPKLFILDPARLGIRGNSSRLVWRVQVGTFVLFIDANDLQLVHKFRDLPNSEQRSVYDYKLQTQGGILVIREGDALGSNMLAEAKAAYGNADAAYKYFLNSFGRDGIGVSDCYQQAAPNEIVSNVRYDSMQNAQWQPSKRQLFFGGGWATPTDIAGHEYTHAVTQYSACLVYTNESGAVNEFFSDFFGQMIKNDRGWLIGEALPGFKPPSRPLRNMADPHNGGFNRNAEFSDGNRGQPDHYSELLTSNDPICSSTMLADNGCVHFNSGILNKAAFLASAGGSHHGIDVPGIGREKVQQILYYTLTTKLTATSMLHDTASNAIAACSDLAAAGESSITQNDCTSFAKAFSAVGLQP